MFFFQRVTFLLFDRHTLWRHVQSVVVPLLAHLVSVIDRDQNMDLLLDTNISESVKRLWLDIFGNDKLLEISRLNLGHRLVVVIALFLLLIIKSNIPCALLIEIIHSSETRAILLQNYISQKRNLCCSMPFSWRIKDYLEELWVHALQHEGNCGHNICSLCNIHVSTGMFCVLKLNYVSQATLHKNLRTSFGRHHWGAT